MMTYQLDFEDFCKKTIENQLEYTNNSLYGRLESCSIVCQWQTNQRKLDHYKMIPQTTASDGHGSRNAVATDRLNKVGRDHQLTQHQWISHHFYLRQV